MDETIIVRQMQSGDTEAFDKLFELYKDKLFRMAYLISGNYADSEDIVQETFVKCFFNCRKLKDEAHQFIMDQIEGLEIKQKTAVVLYYYNGLSTQEIAKIMNCMEGTVKSRLHTARKNLKEALSQEYCHKEDLVWKTTNLML